MERLTGNGRANESNADRSTLLQHIGTSWYNVKHLGLKLCVSLDHIKCMCGFVFRTVRVRTSRMCCVMPVYRGGTVRGTSRVFGAAPSS